MLDGLSILNESGKCILSFSINGATPVSSSLATFIPSVVSHADWSQLIEVTPSQLLYLKKYGNLFVFVPCTTRVPPSMVEELTSRVIDVIERYFKHPLTATMINEHRADIVWILSEMLDMDIPRITQPDIIRQLVYKEDFLSKLMANATLNPAGSRSASGTVTQGSQSAGQSKDISNHRIPDVLVPWEVPWRRSKVSHMKEELFVDIVERVRLVSKAKTRPSGSISSSLTSHSSSAASMVLNKATRIQIAGEIRVLSRLSQMPHVTIDISNNKPAMMLENSQLHPSVDLEKFKSSKGRELALVPADLESVVARYTMTTREVAPVGIGLHRFDDEKSGDGSFKVQISTPIHKKVDHISDLVVAIAFPPTVKLVKELGATSGDLDVSNPHRCQYRFQKTVPMGWNASLHAIATDADGNPVSPLYIELSYSLIGSVLSQTAVKSIHITSLQLKSQDPRPFKGVRYQTIVDSHVVA